MIWNFYFDTLILLWNSVYSVVKNMNTQKKEERTSFCCLILSLKRAENEARTRDPNLGKVMLYQLSYFRKINW